MATPKTTATYVLAASLFAMAGGLIYFSYVLTRVLFAVPGLLEEIQVTSDKIDPIVEEIHGIQELIPGIVDEVTLIREQIPPILEEVEAIRLVIPSILEETGQIRHAIPPILVEVGQIREAVGPILEEASAYRDQIPLILAQIDDVENQIPLIIAEIEGVRATIPDIIAEIEAVRADVPKILKQAEQISMNIEAAGRKAGEGAVTGVFTGIIKAPMNIVAGIAGSGLGVPELGEGDRILGLQAAEKLIKSGQKGATESWRNPDTGIRGTITIVDEFNKSGESFMTINFKAYKRYKKIVDAEAIFRQTEDGAWEVDNVQ